MIIDLNTTDGLPREHRCTHGGTQFAAVLEQYAATPLFAPWPAAYQTMRPNPATANSALNPHPTSSNRREGRHARG